MPDATALEPTPFSKSGAPARAAEVLTLIGWLAACFAASAIGAAAMGTSLGDWYVALRKPAWNPPNWVFGPVWTTLYAMMATAAWLVWRRRLERPREARAALAAFMIQLILNMAWSWIFFAWRRPGLGFLEVLALWIAIAITIRRMDRVSRPAAALMLPYLAWVTFASTLNGVIWRLNA